MLPEIQFIREAAKPVSPSEVAANSSKGEHAVRQSIKRALNRGLIKKVGYGLYANPQYKSPIDATKPCTIKAHQFGALSRLLITISDKNETLFHEILDFMVSTDLDKANWEAITTEWKSWFIKETSQHILEEYPTSKLSKELTNDSR